jgi:hypothetical protein
MTAQPPPTPAVEAFVQAILQSAGQIQLIADHMLRHYNADADPIPDVLQRLLTGILVALMQRHGDADVGTAAQMLTAATELIADELYLVEPSP